MKKYRNSVLLLLFISAAVLVTSGCSDNDSDDSEIEGLIENIIDIQVMAPKDQKKSIYADFKNLLSIIKTAQAQVPGITVTAVKDDNVVDSDTTGSNGRFNLEVPPGNFTLEFDTFPPLSIDLAVTKKSDVSLVVDLNLISEQVIVNTFQIESERISCSGDDEFIFIEPLVTRMTIDGDEDQCVVAKDNCFLSIEVGGNLELKNCTDGLRTRNSARGELRAGALFSMIINSEDNGIKATGDATAVVEGFDINIIGGINGILAEDSSFVQVKPFVFGDCTIIGGEKAIEKRDSAIVDTLGCSEI